jgi:hypothetical protein
VGDQNVEKLGREIDGLVDTDRKRRDQRSPDGSLDVFLP